MFPFESGKTGILCGEFWVILLDCLQSWYLYAIEYEDRYETYDVDGDDFWFDIYSDGTYLLCIDEEYYSGIWTDDGDGFALLDDDSALYLTDCGDNFCGMFFDDGIAYYFAKD